MTDYCEHTRHRMFFSNIDGIVCANCDEVVSIGCARCGANYLLDDMRVSPDADGNRTVCVDCCDEIERIIAKYAARPDGDEILREGAAILRALDTRSTT